MGVHLAPHLSAMHHNPQLQQASLGEVLHGHLRHCHTLDRCLLLPDGVAGEWRHRDHLPHVTPEQEEFEQRGCGLH